MDMTETNYGTQARCSSRCLKLPSEEDVYETELISMYKEWLQISKSQEGMSGRSTRSANRKADAIYDRFMSYKPRPIGSIFNHQTSTLIINSESQQGSNNTSPADTSIDSHSSAKSRPITRSLRQRCRTPEVSNEKKSIKRTASPCTPAQQSLRAHLKRAASGNSSGSGSTNVLGAALNQQHPSVSVTKIRQLLRADSAQKKREEEKERQERLSRDRRAKEERAEAQKKQLLEERASNAKLKREQRLLHAAEVRKAREKKLKEESKRAKEKHSARTIQEHNTPAISEALPSTSKPPNEEQNDGPAKKVLRTVEPPVESHNMNETFKKPAEVKNIDISIQDETTEDQRTKATDVAAWAKAPHLREALIKQFSRPVVEVQEEAFRIIGGADLPVDLDIIFGPNQAVNNRYLCRTSSAVWLTPPNRALKRSGSLVLTPNNPKR